MLLVSPKVKDSDMADGIDLEPLTSSTIDTTLPSDSNVSMDFASMNLCFLSGEADELVVQSESFGTATAEHLIKVKPVSGNAIIEVDKQYVKILHNPDDSDTKIENKIEFVDQIVTLPNTTALRLALAQKVVSTDTMLANSDGNSILQYTAMKGSTECLQYLLTEVYDKFPYELKNDKGFNILHSALEGGKSEKAELIINLLLEGEPSEGKTKRNEEFLNAKTKSGKNALHLCSVFNNKDPIRPLLKAGAKLGEGDSDNNTPLHIAAESGDIESFKRIIKYHSEDRQDKNEALEELKACFLIPNKENKIPILLSEDKPIINAILKYMDINAVADKDTGSLMHLAAERNHLLLAEALVDKNIDVNAFNKIGISPIKYAAKRDSRRVLRFLLDNKADPNYVGEKARGHTALNTACQFGKFVCAKMLIEHGAGVSHPNMIMSALQSAASGGHAIIVKHLIKVESMYVNERGPGMKTPLYQAISKGHSSVAKLLLRHGADPDVLTGSDNETLLHLAVKDGRKEIIGMLLDAGIKSDESLRNGQTPLMLAAEADHADYLPLIIARGYTLSKRDEEGNSIFHYIARKNSCASAKYMIHEIRNLKDDLSVEAQLFENKNSAGKTSYAVALECKHQPVLKIFIGYAPKDYFYRKEPQQIHKFYELKLFDTLKEVINRSVKVDENKGEVSAETIFFDSNEDGQYPNSPDFKPLKQSFLHKLVGCPDQELKYHPIVSIIVDNKLSYYRWWYVISLIFYLFFLVCLGYALIQASTVCDSNLWSYTFPADWARAACEVICLLYLLFFLLNEGVEFFIEWIQVYEENKDEQEESEMTVTYISDSTRGDRKTCLTKLFEAWKKFTNIFRLINVKCRYVFSALNGYFDGVYNFIDWLAIISFVILIILRAISSYVQWTFAGLTFIFFSLSLFKYTRISPSLGAYVNSVFRIFVIDIPRFFVLVLIILIAYIGGIHLAARQQPISDPQISDSLPYQVCNSSRSAFFWFNTDLTQLYDLRRPLLSGILFILDGGPGNYEDDILGDNLFFTLVYLGFAFTIIVVMLNILIAQLSETYGEIVKENSFHYKIELVVTLENKSNLAFLFGKVFRKYTAIESLRIPLTLWKQLKDESPSRSVDQVVLDTNEDLFRTEKTVEHEFEKTSKSFDELNVKLNDIRYKVDELLDFMN